MARPRRPENAWLPRWVERYKNGYRVNRRGHGTHSLCGPEASRAEVWAAYERWQEGLHSQTLTVGDVIDLYFASPQYTKDLKPQTQVDYLRYSKKVRAVFGGCAPDAVTSPMVRMFMDARGEQYRTAANRERTFLSLIMDWGKARGLVTIANPCEAVRPFKEKAGGRYVEDWEYEAFLSFLLEQGHTAHACAMEIAYLCGARQQDVLALTRADVLEDGLLVYQQKTGKRQLKLWSRELREAVELALRTNLEAKVQSRHVIRSRTGAPFTRDGFNTTWQRAMRKALELGVIRQRFRFHDLKVKSVSDYEGDKQAFSGHKSRSVMERYNRSPDRVVSLDKARIKAPK